MSVAVLPSFRGLPQIATTSMTNLLHSLVYHSDGQGLAPTGRDAFPITLAGPFRLLHARS